MFWRFSAGIAAFFLTSSFLFIYLSLRSNADDRVLIHRLKKRRHKRTGSKLGPLPFFALCFAEVLYVAGKKEEGEGKRLRRSGRMWRTRERNVGGREQLFLALGNLGFCSQIYDDRFPKKSLKIRKSKRAEGCCLLTGSKTLN